MKPFVAAALTAFVTLSACDVPTGSEATVIDPVIGKRLVAGEFTFIFQADGTMGGEARGETVVGTYDATASEVCSLYTAPTFLTGREYCSVPTFGDGTVTFNRRDGSTSPAYQIQD